MEFIDLAALTIHDVKNRLAILANRAEARNDVDTLHQALESAATLTRLLTFYKKERGLLSLDVDARVPSDLLEDLALEISKQTDIPIKVIASNAPSLWFYDENLVRMVLLSALYNALRYAKNQIVLSAEELDGFLVFSVRDDGAGYPESMLLAQASPIPVNADGTGLGLHLARHVAALHSNGGQSGFVRLNNQDGARFSLHLPK